MNLFFWRALAITYIPIFLRKVQQETKWYSFSIFNYDFYVDGGNFLTFGLESKSTILYLVINVWSLPLLWAKRGPWKCFLCWKGTNWKVKKLYFHLKQDHRMMLKLGVRPGFSACLRKMRDYTPECEMGQKSSWNWLLIMS